VAVEDGSDITATAVPTIIPEAIVTVGFSTAVTFFTVESQVALLKQQAAARRMK
jgi:hypothetical protein